MHHQLTQRLLLKNGLKKTVSKQHTFPSRLTQSSSVGFSETDVERIQQAGALDAATRALDASPEALQRPRGVLQLVLVCRGGGEEEDLSEPSGDSPVGSRGTATPDASAGRPRSSPSRESSDNEREILR